MDTVTSTASPLRSDAARNRRALLDAARAVFGRRGLDAPLDEIARQAGIGNATLYRHFPTREALVSAVYGDTLRQVVDACEAALARPDAWEAFGEHVLFVCRLQAHICGMADLMITRIEPEPGLERLRRRGHADLERLADRAKAAGALRPDFQPEDLALLMMANAGLIRRTSACAPGAWERIVGYVLDGLRADAATTEVPPSPGSRAV